MAEEPETGHSHLRINFAFLQPYTSTYSKSAAYEGVRYVASADTAHIASELLEYRERKTEREKERRFVVSPDPITPSPALSHDGHPPPAPPAPAGSGSRPGTGNGQSLRGFVSSSLCICVQL